MRACATSQPTLARRLTRPTPRASYASCATSWACTRRRSPSLRRGLCLASGTVMPSDTTAAKAAGNPTGGVMVPVCTNAQSASMPCTCVFPAPSWRRQGA